METLSLRTLSEKVLQRNRQGNIKETSSFLAGKPATEKFPLLGLKTDVPFEPEPVSLPAPLEDLQALFEQADFEIKGAYLPGTLEFIRKDFPELAGEIQEAEDRINQLWLITQKEGGDLGQFQEAVDQWKTLHLRGIRFYLIMETCQ